MRKTKYSDIDIHLDVPTLEKSMQAPKDYFDLAREESRRADDRLKSRTTKAQRIYLGFAFVVFVFFVLAAVKSCG